MVFPKDRAAKRLKVYLSLQQRTGQQISTLLLGFSYYNLKNCSSIFTLAVDAGFFLVVFVRAHFFDIDLSLFFFFFFVLLILCNKNTFQSIVLCRSSYQSAFIWTIIGRGGHKYRKTEKLNRIELTQFFGFDFGFGSSVRCST